MLPFHGFALTQRLALAHSEGNDLSGEVPDALLTLLFGLDRFYLRNDGKMGGKTLASFLASRLTNLKDQWMIDASNEGLEGIVCVYHAWFNKRWHYF